ncbi:MAG: hypothetical protein O7C75_16840 [Verrucomicrobia bacterium]|nr:hypothetical protein [Verrucomicrobiota bacterium]
MKTLLCFSSLLLIPCLIHGQSNPVMIRLVDPLDEPEFYCVDIPGFRQNVQLKAPLMAHTLKRFGSADEMFIFDSPNKGQIFAAEYGLCIEAASAKSGAALFLKEPSDSPLQRFTLTEEGALVLRDHPELEFAVAPGTGSKAGGPSHLRRDLSLKALSDSEAQLTTWKLVKDAATWPE